MKTILIPVLVMIMLALPAVSFSQSQPLGPLYGTDVQLFNYGDCMDAGSKVCVAGNGWIYVLTKLWLPAVDESGWRIFRSIDDGKTYYELAFHIFFNIDALYDVDMVVIGDAADNIHLYLIEASYDPGGTAIQPLKYDANGNSMNIGLTIVEIGKVTSVSIATDYRSPGRGSDPYRIVAAISIEDGLLGSDKIGFLTSPNEFISTDYSTLYQGVAFSLGKVSIALGGTFSNDWGRYVLAFEMNKSGGLGDIGVFCNYADNQGSNWTAPVIVNQTYAGAIGKTRNPSVTMMDNMEVNPSNPNFLPMVIAYEDYSYGYDDVDIMYNSLKDTYVMNSQASVSDFTVHWIPDAGGYNEKEPNLGFDKTYNNFLLTYTSDNGFILPYLYCGMESLLAGNWAFLPSYRDRNTNFHSWYVRPKLDINLNLAQACFSWTEQDEDLTQKIFFDSQYSTVGIHDALVDKQALRLFPNPTNEKFTIETPVNGVITISDLNGRVLMNQTTSESKTRLDISNLPNGTYVVKYLSNNEVITGKVLKN
jgi:hypothetical protein